MRLKYKLNFFNQFLVNLFDVKNNIYLESTCGTQDLEKFDFIKVKKGMIVALTEIDDNKFYLSTAIKVKDIKNNIVYLNNGLCFDKFGEEILN
ncbi:hypothetical protein [Clostridium baratii]|uniref:Uncharacterized protein n=1 Tax=Clostridium baratii TaxID=1561 RepID=A0A174VE18_9CLOT|nr:hypothetical protein [Clostridium baratii]CUQ30348.1 Uncharacterised protein [Clostridium baratii]